MKDLRVMALYNHSIVKMKNTYENWEIFRDYLLKIYTPENHDDCLECINLLERKFNNEKGG